MATQTLRFPAQTGRTITVDLFPLSSDTATATAISATEATNAKQVYSFTRTSLATSDYLGIIKDSGTAVGYAIWRDVSDVAATFDSDDLCTRKLSATQTGVTIPTVTTVGSVSGNVGGNVAGSVGSLTGYTAPDNAGITAIKAKTDNLPASPAATGDIPTANQNADALLKRDWTAISGEAARSVMNALRKLRNNVNLIGSTLTVCKEDDTTSAYTQTVGTNSSQQPISSLDNN